jgi:hypothetical protein
MHGSMHPIVLFISRLEVYISLSIWLTSDIMCCHLILIRYYMSLSTEILLVQIRVSPNYVATIFINIVALTLYTIAGAFHFVNLFAII